MKKILLPLFILSLCTAVPETLVSSEKDEKELKNIIRVSGKGEVNVIPDIAIINIGTEIRAKTLKQASNKSAGIVKKIIDSVKKSGITDKDIQTVNYHIYPEIDHKDKKRKILGYLVRNTLRIKVRKIEDTDKIIEIAVNAGATNVGGLHFDVDDIESAKSEARKKAVESARRKAEELAKYAGVKLGKVISIDESIHLPRPFSTFSAMAKAGSVEAPPVAPGEKTISVTVNMIYSIE